MSVDEYLALVGIDAKFNIWSVVDIQGLLYHCGDSRVLCLSSEFEGICLPFPLSVFLDIGTVSSTGMSSCSNVCHLGVSSTCEVVLVLLCSALAEHVSVCIILSSVPSIFIRVLDCVALSGGSGGSFCM